MPWKALPDDIPLDHEALEPANNGTTFRAPTPGRKYSVEDAIQELGMSAPEAQEFVSTGKDPRDPDAALHSARAGELAPPDMQTGDTGGFAPLPADAQLDSAPDAASPGDQTAPDQGFTDEQKQAVFAYLPKAKDAADLQKFAEELSGGRVHISNAKNVLEEYRKGARSFGFQNTISGEAQQPPDDLLSKIQGVGGALTEHAANALVFDYGPEVGGLIDTLLSPSQYGDFGTNMDRNTAHERAILDGYSSEHPYASAGGELTGAALATPLVGAAAGGLGAARLAGNAGPAARTFAQAVGEGAAYGSGAAGPGNRAAGAAEGAAASAVLAPVAMAIPAIYQAGKSVLSETPSMARRIVAKAIDADQNTPASVGRTVAAANANDVPMAIADTGENVRGLLAAASRASGPARTIARDALEQRQAQLADRVTGAIQRDLGPVANPHEVADTLMTKARNEAAPLYERAYSAPGAVEFTQKAAPLLQRPSMQKALKNAYRIAQEEGRNPEELGFALDKDGNVALSDTVTLGQDDAGNLTMGRDPVTKKGPSWQTLDYIKRGADDVVESYRDKTTGKLVLDTEGRAVNNTLRSYLDAFDQANPDYGAARSAYAGPVKGIAAMNTGRKLLNLTADDIEARLRGMTPYEKEMAALGARRAMAELVSSKGDTADVVHALVGTGKKRAMLARLFGDRKAFGRFVDTLGQEREGFRTFKQARLGSPTAANLEDDATLKLASGAMDMVSHGLPIGTAIRYALKFGVGKIGDKAKQQVAALLSNTDPARFEELAAQLRQEAIRRGLFNRKAGVVASTLGSGAAIAAPKSQAQ